MILATGFLALLGVWNLRRWGLYLLFVVLGVYLLTRLGSPSPGIAWRGILLGTLVRLIGIVAAIASWRRLR